MAIKKEGGDVDVVPTEIPEGSRETPHEKSEGEKIESTSEGTSQKTVDEEVAVINASTLVRKSEFDQAMKDLRNEITGGFQTIGDAIKNLFSPETEEKPGGVETMFDDMSDKGGDD